MARGPFQGTYQQNARQTVTMAPDAIVYINGETDIIGCPSCRKRFDLGKYITSIQVDLSVDSVPGSASLNLSIPKHVVDDFYFDGVPLVSPMMEIEIFSKGYFLLEGIPQFFPIFWGLITEVTNDYSSGEHTVTITCADILKWWDLCRMNINPAFTAPTGQQGRSIFGNVFFGTNPYDTIMTLAQMAFGDVILGTGSLVSIYKEKAQTATFNYALSDIMQYWQSRFTRIRSNLLLYGVNGVAVRGDSLAQGYETGKFTKGKPLVASTAVRVANGGNEATQLIFDPTDKNVTAFRTQFQQAGQVNFWQSEYQTKLELANAAKEAIGFEFFMDVTGDIVFKPPFYNLDVLSNFPVSWVQDIDIIDESYSDSESEVITQITMSGSYGGATDYGLGEEATPTSSVTDYHLLRKYGWRPMPYNSEFMGDPLQMFYHGMDILDRINSRRHSATVTIPIRPELRLGFPIYIAGKDQVWYIRGISHNIQFGARATTTLNLTARREKFKAPNGISVLKTTGDFSKTPATAGSSPANAPAPQQDASPAGPPTIKQLARKAFHLELGEAAQLPPIDVDPSNAAAVKAYEPLILRHPKTGRICGYPNVVMVYTRPFDARSAFVGANGPTGQKAPGQNSYSNKNQKPKITANQQKALNDQIVRTVDEKVTKLSEQHNQNRWKYGLNSAGVYVYAHDEQKLITQFALLPAQNITVTKDGSELTEKPFQSQSAMVRPVSDERGFEVIGHFRYGRGVAIRDGSLILNEGGNNSKASVAIQVALSGDLFASLNAQSQGLTTISTAYANPADALMRMAPSDERLQTAATVVPGSGGKTAKFSDVGTNYVDVAPLGSPEQKGVFQSVEAGQLSRALTLAEMSVTDSPPNDDECVCQVGRSDLAFIANGYQIKTMNAASPDDSELFNNQGAAYGATFKSADNLRKSVQSLNAQYSATVESIAALEKQLSTATTVAAQEAAAKAITAAQEALIDTQAQIAEAEAELEGVDAQLSQMSEDPASLGQPKPSAMKFSNFRSKVEDYLWNLYSALDADHVPFENALRGDPSGQDENYRPLPDLFTGRETDPEYGSFTPPFSSSNRSALGDPIAMAMQGSSAKSDLAKTWGEFGDNLKKNSKKAELGGEIAALHAKIARLEARLAQEGTITFENPAAIQAEIAQAQQDLINKQAQLAMLQ